MLSVSLHIYARHSTIVAFHTRLMFGAAGRSDHALDALVFLFFSSYDEWLSGMELIGGNAGHCTSRSPPPNSKFGENWSAKLVTLEKDDVTKS